MLTKFWFKLAVVAIVPWFAHAQTLEDFPAKPVKIVIPFPPGALTDSLGRLLANKLQEQWQQPVIVENRPGAGGNIGTEAVSRAPADGYTLLFTPQSTLTLAKLINPGLSFDPERMVPIATVSRSTVLMLANPRLPATSVAELIEHGKANPGRLNFAHPGVGSTAQLANDLFFKLGDIEGVNVPYQGIAPAVTALIAGEVDILFDAMGNAMPHVQAGRLRALAVGGAQRSAAAPELPTIAETVPGFNVSLWSVLAAPAGTPAPLVETISAAVTQALGHPDFLARAAAVPGMELVGESAAQTEAALQEERRQWAQVVDTAARQP